jgi:NAD(P)-dependent dehydrogenase (short-subunit alcohol dehydrogenase family)
MRLKDKVALVTGARTGLGKAIAPMFAQEGASVALTGRRAEPLEKTLGEISHGGGNGLVKDMAMDDAARGVRVNGGCPAYGETDFNRELLAGLRKTGEYDALVNMHPLGFLGSPKDVVNGAVHLASDAARWMTGVALNIDGGMSATR